MAKARVERVAVVDDDGAVRLSTERLLACAGYEIDSYEGGERFVREAPLRDHDCVLLDIRMPGMDGLSVLRALAAQQGVVPPVIILTGHGDVPLAVEAMKLGADAFIEKPYRSDQLLSAIRRAIDTARTRGG